MARRQIRGGYVVRDANGQALVYIYSRDNEADALQAKVLSKDKVRRIAIKRREGAGAIEAQLPCSRQRHAIPNLRGGRRFKSLPFGPSVCGLDNIGERVMDQFGQISGQIRLVDADYLEAAVLDTSDSSRLRMPCFRTARSLNADAEQDVKIVIRPHGRDELQDTLVPDIDHTITAFLFRIPELPAERGWNGGQAQTTERWESNVIAADPTTGEIKKSIHLPSSNFSGILTTAGGLIFTALLDGTVAAHDDASLSELWRMNLGSGFSPPPMTFEVNPGPLSRRDVWGGVRRSSPSAPFASCATIRAAPLSSRSPPRRAAAGPAASRD
jgi:hypothetical protein